MQVGFEIVHFVKEAQKDGEESGVHPNGGSYTEDAAIAASAAQAAARAAQAAAEAAAAATAIMEQTVNGIPDTSAQATEALEDNDGQ